MTKKVILFDFDGTLFDTQSAYYECSNQLALKYRFKMHEDWEKYRDMPAKDFLFDVLKLSWFQLPFFIADMKKLFQEKIHSVKPFEGIPELLNELNQFYELGIITSNGEYAVKELLTNYELDYFKYKDFDASILNKKWCLKRFLSKSKISNKDVIYIGDEYRDGKACIEANIDFIAVSWGMNNTEILKEANPLMVAESPIDILDYLLTTL
ncbi:HAD hydrolase-like protein [Halosquirtibacter laminarini]|uniref:HAD hydrolase-like protein n=1 Tax=Halosquirtibacter laminarini TaxID=3374600 RepID=A0AC61NF14_9BACT|nr:HAD hydrolase-like protein [Prolixibacteraceae bacterium]